MNASEARELLTSCEVTEALRLFGFGRFQVGGQEAVSDTSLQPGERPPTGDDGEAA